MKIIYFLVNEMLDEWEYVNRYRENNRLKRLLKATISSKASKEKT